MNLFMVKESIFLANHSFLPLFSWESIHSFLKFLFLAHFHNGVYVELFDLTLSLPLYSASKQRKEIMKRKAILGQVQHMVKFRFLMWIKIIALMTQYTEVKH